MGDTRARKKNIWGLSYVGIYVFYLKILKGGYAHFYMYIFHF